MTYSKLEKLGPSRVKLEIEVPATKMAKFFEVAWEKLAPTVEVKGFRPGQAPKPLIINALGRNRILKEVLDMALQKSYPEALAEHRLKPVQSPAITIKDIRWEEGLDGGVQPFTYQAEVDIIAQFELPDLGQIAVKAPQEKIEVKDEEVQTVLSHLQRQSATFKDIDRGAQTGDRLEINFEGMVDTVKQENLSSLNYPVILGSNVLIPGFEQELMGLKKGEKKEFDLEVKQKDRQEKVHFRVEVTDTKEVILPNLDDEFSQKFNQKNVEVLKRVIAQDIQKQKELVQKRKVEKEVLEKILSKTQVDVPESLIAQETSRLIDNFKNQVQSQGANFDNYLSSIKKTAEDLAKDLRPQAEKNAKIGLVLGEVVVLEKIDTKDPQAPQKAIDRLVAKVVK